MDKNGIVGEFYFGESTISASVTGEFTVNFYHGGEWKFDVGEIQKLDSILEDIHNDQKNFEDHIFWRTNGSKIIQVFRQDDFFSISIRVIEGGTKKAHFRNSELAMLRDRIAKLTSKGAPYGNSVKLLEIIEESRLEELVTSQRIPLNNSNSNTPLIIEKEFSRETRKEVQVDFSFGIGLDYYITLGLESHFGVKQEDVLTERITVRMEANPKENKIYTIHWKEVWIAGYAVFDVDGRSTEKIPFRLKSGLEPEINQEYV
ncbi:hypothetical protein KQH61_05085 [bacterium]|nr:hypothetical protein [bacterium]MCB2179275.1 hypothetical protein [bacterium]